jgi:hypothetical protein
MSAIKNGRGAGRHLSDCGPAARRSSGATRNEAVSERLNLIGDTVLGGQRGFWWPATVSLGPSDCGRPPFCTPTFFPWARETGDSCACSMTSRHAFSSHYRWAHASQLASQWLDLTEGRLRLDRLVPQRRTDRLSSPGLRPFLARQETLTAAVLCCAPARARVRRRSPPASRSPSRPRWSRARNSKEK